MPRPVAPYPCRLAELHGEVREIDEIIGSDIYGLDKELDLAQERLPLPEVKAIVREYGAVELHGGRTGGCGVARQAHAEDCPIALRGPYRDGAPVRTGDLLRDE